MTFLKKHALKLFVFLAVTGILFLLWYHLFPVKISFDHTVYSQNGKEVNLKGELHYYRSVFSKENVQGEVYFGDVKYSTPLDSSVSSGGPLKFVLLNFEGDRDDTMRDKLIINFIGKGYETSI